MQAIAAYLDYRQYLGDFYAERKARNPRYSHRLFAQKAGLTSTGFFSEVLNGKRQLAPPPPMPSTWPALTPTGRPTPTG